MNKRNLNFIEILLPAVLVLLINSQDLKAGEIFKIIEDELSQLIQLTQSSVVSISSTIPYSYEVASEPSAIRFWGEKSQKRRTVNIKNIASGLIFNEAGYVVTRSSVMQYAEKITVTLYDETTLHAEFIGVDYETGLTVLKIKKSDLIPAELGTGEEIKVGKWIAIIGNSIGVSPSISLGLINGIRHEQDSLIQLSAFINPGNSGCPVFTMSGKVIGIVAARLNVGDANYSPFFESQPLEGGIAYPIDLIKIIANRIILAGGRKKAWFGITTQDLNSSNGPVVITDVTKGSPAYEAGLQHGDILLRINEINIKRSLDLMRLGQTSEPGNEYKVTIERDDKLMEMSIILGEWPQDSDLPKQRVPIQLVDNPSIFDHESFESLNPAYQYLQEINNLQIRVQALETELKNLKKQLKK